jgi:hypothetical protein
VGEHAALADGHGSTLLRITANTEEMSKFLPNRFNSLKIEKKKLNKSRVLYR